MEENIKEGWLMKQGGKRRNWKRRWFVLRGYDLLYFRKPPKGGNTKPSGKIPVQIMTEVESANDIKGKKIKPRMKITVRGERKSYLIEGDSEQDIKHWIQCLQKAISELNDGQPTENHKQTSDNSDFQVESSGSERDNEGKKPRLGVNRRMSPETTRFAKLLYQAVVEDDIDKVQLLIEKHHANSGWKNPIDNNRTALHVAVDLGHIGCAKKILKSGADATFRARDSDGWTVLHVAAYKGNLDCITLLLQTSACKAQVLVRDNKGRTAAYLAILAGEPLCAEKLIEAADKLDSSENSWTELHKNCLKDHATVKSYAEESSTEFDKNLNAKGDFGLTPIFLAVCRGDGDLIKFLVEKGAKTDVVDAGEKGLLHFAASKGKEQCIRAVIGCDGVKVNALDIMKKTPLHFAVGRGHSEAAKVLLQTGAVVNPKDKYGFQPLHTASLHGRSKCVQLLLSHKADPNSKGDGDLTPLHLAIFSNKPECVSILLSQNAKIDAKDEEGKTPLHEAAFGGFLACVQILQKAGASMNEMDFRKKTALHRAIEGGNFPEIVTLLLDAGIDTNIKDAKGMTALIKAISYERNSISEILVNRKANVNLTGDHGVTPLIKAIAMGNVKIVQLLLSKGADVNQPMANGWTALHEASRLGDLGILQALFGTRDVPINLNPIEKEQGNTPLAIAVMKNHSACASYLLSNNADPNLPDRKDYSPLHKAVMNQNLEIVEMLLKSKADVNAKTKSGVAPVMLSCRSSDSASDKVTRVLVENGADLRHSDNQKNSALHEVAKIGNLNTAKFLFSKMASDVSDVVNQKNMAQQTPLLIATRFSKGSGLPKLFLDRGADPLVIDAEGNSAVHLACIAGNSAGLTLFLSSTSNAHLAKLANKKGKTPLHLACVGGHKDCAQSLLKANVDVNAADKSGNVPLHDAAAHGHLEIMKLLVAVDGIEMNKTNNNKMTPLLMACVQKAGECIQILLKNGADGKDVLPEDRSTALHHAAGTGDVVSCEYLLDQGNVPVDAQANDGTVPLHWAAKGSSAAVIELLLKRKANTAVKDKKGRTPLHIAAEQGNVNVLKALLNHGADINEKDQNQRTALHDAATEGHPGAIATLIKQKGVNLNVQDLLGRTALYEAASNGNIECAKILLGEYAGESPGDEGSIDVSISEERGLTPLHAAALNDASLVQLLIKHGAEVNCTNDTGVTPLHNATYLGDYDSVVVLVEKGANVHCQGAKKQSPLHNAASTGKEDVVRFLIDHNADVNARDKYKKTPLHSAALKGNYEVMKVLVKEGADLNANNEHNITPLHITAAKGHKACSELLIRNGANVNCVNIQGVAPLHEAAFNGFMDTAKLLITNGADTNATAVQNLTPLHNAASSGQSGIVELLIDNGANAECVTTKKFTPLHCAVAGGHVVCAEKLVEKGASVEAKDSLGDTPLHKAAMNGHETCVRFLVEKGSPVNLKNVNKSTPLDLALSNGHTAVVQLLRT